MKKKGLVRIALIVLALFAAWEIAGYYFVSADAKKVVADINAGKAVWSDYYGLDLSENLAEYLLGEENPGIVSKIMTDAKISIKVSPLILNSVKVTFTINTIDYAGFVNHCEGLGIVEHEQMLLGGTSTRVYAVDFVSDYFEKDYTIGKLSAIYYKDGKNKTFQVMVQEGKLYVNAQSLAEKLNFMFGVNGGEVQILLDDEWRGRRIANFELNSKQAWYYDGTEIVEYEMPFATIENEEGYWIPLRFAIKMMGAEMVLVGDDIYISEFHETIENAVERVDDVYQKSVQLILGMERIYDDYTEVEKQIMLAELKEKEWLQKIVDVWDARSVDGANYDELASFLVSNYSPEFLQDSKQYLELLNIYVANPIVWNNAAAYGEDTVDMISILAGYSNAWEVTNLFQDAVEGLEIQNPELTVRQRHYPEDCETMRWKVISQSGHIYTTKRMRSH